MGAGGPFFFLRLVLKLWPVLADDGGMEIRELYRAWLDADHKFGQALTNLFGRKAGDARYQPHKWPAAVRTYWQKVEEAEAAFNAAGGPAWLKGLSVSS